MRILERDGLLILLGIAAGSADGWSYFGMGQAFVANMTGNTVLVGLAVFQPHGDLFHPALSLGCNAVGVAAATFFTRKMLPESLWPRAVSWTLLLEGLLMAAAEVGWLAIGRHAAHLQRDNTTGLNVLLGCVAFAIGMQSGAMLQLKIPGIVTTYITGTWTTLTSGVVRFTTRKAKQPRGQKLEFEQRMLMQGALLAAYFLAAVLTGWLFRYMPGVVGAVPALCVTAAAVAGLVRA